MAADIPDAPVLSLPLASSGHSRCFSTCDSLHTIARAAHMRLTHVPAILDLDPGPGFPFAAPFAGMLPRRPEWFTIQALSR